MPCHNRAEVTAAQTELLTEVFDEVHVYGGCCGQAGTARFRHPSIAARVGEMLVEEIGWRPSDIIVSNCPSCRDGVATALRTTGAPWMHGARMPLVQDIGSGLLRAWHSSLDWR